VRGLIDCPELSNKIMLRLHRYKKYTVFRVPVFSTNYRRNSFLIRALEATNEVCCDFDIIHDSLNVIKETLSDRLLRDLLIQLLLFISF
jgi:hypothetical protein